MNSIKECRTLNNGVQIPCLGFGTYKAAEGSTSKIIMAEAAAAASLQSEEG